MLKLGFLLLSLTVVSVFARVRVYNSDEIVDTPFNTCGFYANINDVKTAGIVNTIAAECKTLLGSSPDSVEVNDDTYPYKLCIAAANATFSDLLPTTAQAVVAQDSFNNTTNQNVSHTFSLAGTYTNALTISTTTSVSFSVDVDYTMAIPDRFSLKFAMNTTFSSSKTTTQSSSMDETYTSSTTLNCDPSCAYAASLNVQTLLYKATVDVPICLTGYAKCAYNSRVNGHYWWYVLVDDFISLDQRCAVQDGILASAMSVSSDTSLGKTCYPPSKSK